MKAVKIVNDHIPKKGEVLTIFTTGLAKYKKPDIPAPPNIHNLPLCLISNKNGNNEWTTIEVPNPPNIYNIPLALVAKENNINEWTAIDIPNIPNPPNIYNIPLALVVRENGISEWTTIEVPEPQADQDYIYKLLGISDGPLYQAHVGEFLGVNTFQVGVILSPENPNTGDKFFIQDIQNNFDRQSLQIVFDKFDNQNNVTYIADIRGKTHSFIYNSITGWKEIF